MSASALADDLALSLYGNTARVRGVHALGWEVAWDTSKYPKGGVSSVYLQTDCNLESVR